MALKRILATILVAVISSGSVLAQSVAGGDVAITSNPPGALATLEGEATVSGVTPARFRHLLIGDYRLVVRMYGYETYSTRVYLDPTRTMEFSVNLAPKTRVKAALRSMIIPGWGQYYSDQKTKAWTLALLAAGSAAAYLIADSRFDDKFDEYQTRLREYDATSSVDELHRLHPGLMAAQRDAWDAENARRVTIAVNVGVWALNVLDNLIFFPHHPEGFRVKGLTVKPTSDFRQLGLSLATNF